MSTAHNGRGALVAGVLAALLASVCCLGPLVLVALGLSGAWLGNVWVLEPYRPFFIGAAVLALLVAGWRIFRPATECEPDAACAAQKTRTVSKILFVIVAALVGVALAFPYILRLFY